MKVSMFSKTAFYIVLIVAIVLISKVDVAMAKGKSQLPAKIKSTNAVAAENGSSEAMGGGVLRSDSSGMKFNTDSTAPESKDGTSPLQFKIPGISPQEPVKPETYSESGLGEDEPFRAFLGYPKHQVGLFVSPENYKSQWNFQGTKFDFSTSATNFGLNYRFLASPIFTIEAEWSHYSQAVSGATVNGFLIQESKASYDSFYANTQFSVANFSYGQKVFLGFLIGKDSYPVLKFVGDLVHLNLGKVDDVVLGANIKYHVQFSEAWKANATIGLNYGTGIGNSGALTSKSNSSYYGRLLGAWTFRGHNQVSLGGEYLLRNAELNGKIGSASYNWKTTSAAVGARIEYAYTF